MGSQNAKAMPPPQPKPAAAPKPLAAAPRPPADPAAAPTVHGYSRTYGGEVTLPAGRAPSGGQPVPQHPGPAPYNGYSLSRPTMGHGYGHEYEATQRPGSAPYNGSRPTTGHGFGYNYGGEGTQYPDPALYNGSRPTTSHGYGYKYGGEAIQYPGSPPYGGYHSSGYGHQNGEEVISVKYIHHPPSNAPPEIFSSYRF
eukprot:TRINITY_DN277_c0_g1_i5.p1 TRINITY_DN277_c0_g1~~TRINITY_DN277_c0_g1_i5.p1  ORF type:complete len:206 (+),score=24.58 TRINITY_DN277_c0_g1_i5:27-620(+)